MKGNLERSEIVAKLDAAEGKAQMAANPFLTLPINYSI
jgi:hypothetical protein